MNIAIIANSEKYSVREPFNHTLRWADKHSIQIYISQQLAGLIENKDHHSVNVAASEEEAINNSDIIAAIGGDGTMLYAARLLKMLPSRCWVSTAGGWVLWPIRIRRIWKRPFFV